jgi:hypothetical protein
MCKDRRAGGNKQGNERTENNRRMKENSENINY